MLLFVGLLFVLLSIYGYHVSKVVYSPYTVMSGVWGIVILLYIISAPAFYPIQGKFPYMILLWVVVFFFSSIFIDKMVRLYLCKNTMNGFVLNNKMWCLLLVIAIPVGLYSIYSSIQYASQNPELFFMALRSANTGEEENVENSLGILEYFCTSLLILYLVALTLKKGNKIQLWVLIIINVGLSIMTMAKSMFMQLFLVTIVILLSQHLIRKRHVLFSGIALAIIFVVISILRMADQSDDFQMKDFVDTYMFSGMVAFDTINIVPTEDGRYVFRFIYAIAHALNPTIPVSKPILEYTTISPTGDVTNVYTALFPVYSDYGWTGILFFSFFIGGFTGLLYAFACKYVPFMIVYANVVFFIVMEFMGDYWFINLSTFFQYVFFTMILFKPIKIKING